MSVIKPKFGRAKQAASDLAAPVLSEDKIATEFVDRHAAEVRYDATQKQWVLWDGYRWVRTRVQACD